jgi:Protein of unknown function (DUF1761)
MHIAGFNWVAVLVAAIAVQPIGALWYSKLLFAGAWMRELGITPTQIHGTPHAAQFAVGFLAPLVSAAALAWLAGAAGMTGLAPGALLGALAAVGLAVAGVAPHYAFAGRSLRLFLIDAGHALVVLIVLGAIVGVWR